MCSLCSVTNSTNIGRVGDQMTNFLFGSRKGQFWCRKYIGKKHKKSLYYTCFNRLLELFDMRIYFYIGVLTKSDLDLENRVTLITTNIVAEKTSGSVMFPMGGSDGFCWSVFWRERK